MNYEPNETRRQGRQTIKQRTQFVSLNGITVGLLFHGYEEERYLCIGALYVGVDLSPYPSIRLKR